MTNAKNVRIVIPAFKNNISLNERNSLRQCINILSSYEIVLVCPKGLKLDEYLCERPNFKIEYFEKYYFESIKTYNKLLLSKEFYNRFVDFKYILIYQLDAWVFRDELNYWCSKGYDYIGAPWIDIEIYKWLKLDIYPKYLHLIHRFLGKGRLLAQVGNGGFSLRKVNSFLTNLNLFSRVANNWRANEDSFYSHYVRTFNPFFKIAPFNEALKFSFDINPSKAYELNEGFLPFGCHAWYKDNDTYKGNYRFWETIIKNDILS